MISKLCTKLYLAAKKPLQKFHSEEDAPTMVEYGLMVALIAVVCIAAVTFIGTNLSTLFNGVGANLVLN
jgi:pilus assembly protein Flp/PilA